MNNLPKRLLRHFAPRNDKKTAYLHPILLPHRQALLPVIASAARQSPDMVPRVRFTQSNRGNRGIRELPEILSNLIFSALFRTLTLLPILLLKNRSP